MLDLLQPLFWESDFAASEGFLKIGILITMIEQNGKHGGYWIGRMGSITLSI